MVGRIRVVARTQQLNVRVQSPLRVAAVEMRVREPLKIGHITGVALALVLEQRGGPDVVSLFQKLGEIRDLHAGVARGFSRNSGRRRARLGHHHDGRRAGSVPCIAISPCRLLWRSRGRRQVENVDRERCETVRMIRRLLAQFYLSFRHGNSINCGYRFSKIYRTIYRKLVFHTMSQRPWISSGSSSLQTRPAEPHTTHPRAALVRV